MLAEHRSTAKRPSSVRGASSPMPFPPASRYPPSVDSWLASLNGALPRVRRDDPNYFAADPTSLITTSTVNSFTTGTGSAIFESLAPLLSSAASELIMVTCFWARSSSLNTLNAVLRSLSDKATARGNSKIRVRICFSSCSLFQKLFHRPSARGQVYPPNVWSSKLGLPPVQELGGLDMQVKSVFLLPFSVMHPKFVVIDRHTVALPSCNVSWEDWFEGCVTITGGIAAQFVRFYAEFWERTTLDALPALAHSSQMPLSSTDVAKPLVDRGAHAYTHTRFPTTASGSSAIATLFLPSPHHRNPRPSFFSPASAPSTPLNNLLLNAFAHAQTSISIQTPNLTSPPVSAALVDALGRGVHVRILTSERLMRLEQLVTTGTTTARSVQRLVKRHRRLCADFEAVKAERGEEEQAIGVCRQPGKLAVRYFVCSEGESGRGEPQQSHLKMTIVDGEIVVLGSGNMDRASWFTSQEIGVAFYDSSFTAAVERLVDEVMKSRGKVVV